LAPTDGANFRIFLVFITHGEVSAEAIPNAGKPIEFSWAYRRTYPPLKDGQGFYELYCFQAHANNLAHESCNVFVVVEAVVIARTSVQKGTDARLRRFYHDVQRTTRTISL
jgi:hypothetical protein